MAAAIDGQHQAGILQAIERQSARRGNHHPAIDQPAAGGVLGALEGVEMDLGGVLIELVRPPDLSVITHRRWDA
jgi:hypothetical protein